MNQRNLGVFRISEQLIRKEPDKVAQIFALMKAVPIRAEFLFSAQEIEYTAIAELFDGVPEGEALPKYNIEFTSGASGWPELVKVIRQGTANEPT